ncbi:MAG TPA: glycoside hydrolase family 2 TIM barrel-domain containing protein [Clostridia bacterium]|nr:glycoside hydrolase family 2 TIM barrel-domain containing protein [Clostridia bacterium]
MKDVNNQPRPEFPNPQFERKNWLNLNGEWEFEIDNAVSGVDRKLFNAQKLNDKIVVPFCPESELSGVKNVDFMNAVWYRKVVDLSDYNLKNNVFIHFGAVDYKSTVYVNGKYVGEHIGGYSSFSFNITSHLNVGENVIIVNAQDDVRSPLVPRGKQSEKYYSHQCDYTRTTGIWQTVWLEFVPKSYIKSFKLNTDIHNSTLEIQAVCEGDGEFEAKTFFEGRMTGSLKKKTCGGFLSLSIPLSETHLWEVGKGNLYDLELSFDEDEVLSYFGLRDVRLDGYKFLINEKPVFQRLVLDQGFYKKGIYTAPTEEDLINDIKISANAGFNGARLHEKVFEPRFLYHCDRLGYIVWGEYANWGVDYSNPSALAQILPEWCEVVERDFNHPSIIGWCPFNETWDYDGRKQNDDLLKIVYETTKRLDPTRPCIDTSGNFHVVTDIFDVHDYEQDPKIFKENYDKFSGDNPQFVDRHDKRQIYNNEPMFVSEYGGIKWSKETENAWGYGNSPKTEEEFFARYKGLTDVLIDNEKMFGFCYTQLYDIEQEQNGLYTYDRKPKFDMEFFKTVNTRKAAIEK